MSPQRAAHKVTSSWALPADLELSFLGAAVHAQCPYCDVKMPMNSNLVRFKNRGSRAQTAALCSIPPTLQGHHRWKPLPYVPALQHSNVPWILWIFKSAMVASAYYLNAWRDEAGRPKVRDHPELYNKSMPQNKMKIKSSSVYPPLTPPHPLSHLIFTPVTKSSNSFPIWSFSDASLLQRTLKPQLLFAPRTSLWHWP